MTISFNLNPLLGSKLSISCATWKGISVVILVVIAKDLLDVAATSGRQSGSVFVAINVLERDFLVTHKKH